MREIIFNGHLVDALQSSLIEAGSRVLLKKGTHSGDCLSTVTGVTVKPYTDGVVVDGSILSSGGNVLFDSLVITDSDFINRVSEQTGSAPTDISSRTGLQGLATGIEFRDCIIHDTAQGGYCPDEATVIFDGCIMYYNGWIAPDRGHGHGIYAQKNVIIRKCIVFCNFGWGVHVYGEGNQLINNATIENTISFSNGILSGEACPNLLLGRSGTIVNPVWRGNCTYHSLTMMRKNDFGLTGTITEGIMTDNYLPDGCNIADGTFSEQNGNVFEPETVNKVFVIPVRDRLHVAVYNWQLLDAVDVDVSAIWNDGTQVQVRNVQDYFTDTQTLTVTAGGITVNMQAANRTVATPYGWTAPAKSFPQFGAFVMVKQ